MSSIKIILVVGVALLMTGCAGGSLLEKDPRCPFSERGGCQSVKSINKMIDENKYRLDGDFVRQPNLTVKTCTQCRKIMPVYIPKSAQMGRESQKHIEIIEVDLLEK